MAVYRLGEDSPTVAASCYIAANAVVLGKVILLENSSVWFGATLRGDNETISIGAGSNVQDCAVLHTDPGFPLIGRCPGVDRASGHAARLHRRRWHVDRHTGGGAQRRRHRQMLSGRRRRPHHRAQGICRRQPDSRRAGARSCGNSSRRSATISSRSRKIMRYAVRTTGLICRRWPRSSILVLVKITQDQLNGEANGARKISRVEPA